MTSETSGLNLNGADDSESEEELSTVVDENEDVSLVQLLKHIFATTCANILHMFACK